MKQALILQQNRYTSQSMLSVLEVTLPVFALVFCGYVAAARRMLPDKAVEGINAFVFWFALPAMLFRVVAQRPIGDLIDGRFTLGYLVASFALFGLTAWLARSGRLTGTVQSVGQSAALSLNAAHGNVGYLGLPLVGEISARALPTVALIIICDIFVVISLTIAILEWHTRRGAGGSIILKVAAGLARSPLVFSLAAGLIFSLFAIPQPAVFDNFTRLLGAAAGPCALFAIGAALGGRKLEVDREIGGLVLLKLVLYPVLMAVSLLLVFKPDPYAAAVAVVCAALPSASNGFIVAQRYGMSTHAISASIVSGTALAVVTVSFVIWAVGLRS